MYIRFAPKYAAMALLSIMGSVAHAEVFELSSSGEMVNITKPVPSSVPSETASGIDIPASGPIMMRDLRVEQPILAQPRVVTSAVSPLRAAASVAIPGANPGNSGDVRQMIAYAARRYGVDPALLDALAWQESRYNQRARSSAGAIGVMQLMPGTARDLGVSDPNNMSQNILGGAAYLRAQLEEFDNNVPLALAAYNAGPGAVKKYSGIPPFRETQNYVRSILQRLSTTSQNDAR